MNFDTLIFSAQNKFVGVSLHGEADGEVADPPISQFEVLNIPNFPQNIDFRRRRRRLPTSS